MGLPRATPREPSTPTLFGQQYTSDQVVIGTRQWHTSGVWGTLLIGIVFTVLGGVVLVINVTNVLTR